MGKVSRTLRATYRIKPQVYVSCYLDAVQLGNDGARVTVGLRRRADTLLPVGTRLYLQPGSTPVPGVPIPAEGEIVLPFITVEDYFQDAFSRETMHVCSSVQVSREPQRRQQERKTAFFGLSLENSLTFQVTDGSLAGLGLMIRSHHVVPELVPGRTFEFISGEERLPGTIRHILYNWKTGEHRLGMVLGGLEARQRKRLQELIAGEVTGSAGPASGTVRSHGA